MLEQGSNNMIVTSAHREMLRQSSQDTISKSARFQHLETSIINTEHTKQNRCYNHINAEHIVE